MPEQQAGNINSGYRPQHSGSGNSAVQVDSLQVDSLQVDSLQVDSLQGEGSYGILMDDGMAQYIAKAQGEMQGGGADTTGLSGVYVLMAALFCVVGMKFRNNSGYLKALISDLTDARKRHNAFDDTVRETSLLVLLNIMWIVCTGVILWYLVKECAGGLNVQIGDSFGLKVGDSAGMWRCIGVAGIYELVMTLGYWVTGNVFGDKRSAELWLKGAYASNGLESLLLFPLALLLTCYGGISGVLLIIAAIVIGIGKIVFFYKGFRIFFGQISSWMLFLYYLCSLEIVPIIMAYILAVGVCSV